MIINKLKKIFLKKKNTKKTKDILNNIIEISYSNCLNKNFAISNTFNSRYEVIIILIFLLYLRLNKDKKKREELQKVYDQKFLLKQFLFLDQVA